MSAQWEKAEAFRALHVRGAAFVLANAWDVGSARMMAGMGFSALGTTSAGFAFSQGMIDRVGVTSRDSALAHCREIAAATGLPVSADLEDGFGASPEAVAETVRLAAEVGLVGCTIEDVTGDRDAPIYAFEMALERVRAAIAAARSLPFPFTLTARAENFLHGRPDLEDTIKRLQAFEEAGADVLYAPGLPDLAAIEKVCKAVGGPVNVVIGVGAKGLSHDALKSAGVTRISLGSALARAAYGAALGAARGILDDGCFSLTEQGAPFARIEDLIRAGSPIAKTDG